MIEYKQSDAFKNPLPSEINLKYGERSMKKFRLMKLKIEDFIYSTVISLVKSYKTGNSDENIYMILCRTGVREEIILKNEKDFENFKNSDFIHIYLDKSYLKLEFFYGKPMEIIKEKNKNNKIEKIFQDLINDSNSKIILDITLNYVVKDREFTEKLFADLIDKNVIKSSEINKDDFSKKLIQNLLTNIMQNYDTMLNTRSSFENLKLNMSFTKIDNVSNDEINQNKDFKPFSELYNPNEIEDFSSRIVRDTLSSIQLTK